MRIDLGPLRDLGGFLGAAVVDSETGLVLGRLGADSESLDVAAAGNVEVMRATRAMLHALESDDEVEDLMTCLSRQFHLVRPLSANPALLLYLRLDRTHANLALARLALKNVDAAVGD